LRAVVAAVVLSSLGVELVSVDHRVFQVQMNLLKFVSFAASRLRRRHLLLLSTRSKAVVMVDVPSARKLPVSLLRTGLRHAQRVEVSILLLAYWVRHLRVCKPLKAHRTLARGLASDLAEDSNRLNGALKVLTAVLRNYLPEVARQNVLAWSRSA
jgi:hypothetical protein